MTQSAFSDTVFTPRSTHRLTTDRYRAPAGARPTHKTHRRRDELLLQKYVPFNPFHAYISGSFLKPSQPVHSQSFISTPEAGSTIRFIDYSERIWLFAPCPSVCLVSLLTRKPTSRRAPDLLCSAHRCNLQIHRRRTSTLTTCSPSASSLTSTSCHLSDASSRQTTAHTSNSNTRTSRD